MVLAVAILAALASCLANLCVTHLRLSNRADNAMNATNLARSAIAAGIARVAETPKYGTSDGPADRTILIETEQGAGYLTFSPEAALEQNVPHSTNNVGNSADVLGAGGVSIAPDTIHLNARGICNGVERRVEACVKVPSYPWAVAATGDLEITTGVTVAALPPGVWPPTEDQLEPADLVSNSTSAAAITLSGASRVMGNVEASGGIVVQGDQVVVEGQIRDHADPTDIPTLDPADYDPVSAGITFDNLDFLATGAAGAGPASGPLFPAAPGSGATTATPGLLTVNGAARCEGDLTLSSGLLLDAGSLFVNGNLVVNGNIDGFGVLIVTGNVTVRSGTTLQAANQVALLAGGSVDMRGQGPATTAIRGVFYARDGIVAREMTVIGALVAGGTSSNIQLENVSVYQQQAVELAPTQGGLGSSVEIGGGWGEVFPGGTGPFGSSGGFYMPPITITVPNFLGTTPPPASGGTLAGPSNFLSFRDRMKVVSWLER